MAWAVGIGIALVLLFLFPRQMLLLIGAIVAIGAAIGGFFYLKDQNEQAKRALVTATARIDPQVCAEITWPVLVIITNGSKETINSVSFNLEALHPGYSEPVYRDWYVNSDKILGPGDSFLQCWGLDKYGWGGRPMPLESLQWKATVSSVRWAS